MLKILPMQTQSKIKKELQDEYINKKIKPILENLIVDLLIHKPEEVKSHMIRWLQNKIDSTSINPNTNSTNEDEKSNIIL